MKRYIKRRLPSFVFFFSLVNVATTGFFWSWANIGTRFSPYAVGGSRYDSEQGGRF